MNGINIQKAQRLDEIVKHKFLECDSGEKFEKELNALVASGWKLVNIQTHQSYSDKQEKTIYSYIGVLVKTGL